MIQIYKEIETCRFWKARKHLRELQMVGWLMAVRVDVFFFASWKYAHGICRSFIQTYLYIIYSIYIYCYLLRTLEHGILSYCVSCTYMCIYIFYHILPIHELHNVNLTLILNADAMLSKRQKKTYVSLSQNDHTLWSLIHLSFIITCVVQTYHWKNHVPCTLW